MFTDPPSTAGTNKLSIDMLGGFSFRLAGEPLSFPNRKACAVVAYLLLENKPMETRERLAGLLWSEFDEDKARASLRQSLRQLRDLFDRAGFAGFEAQRSHVCLDGRGLDVDCLKVLSETSAGAVPKRLLDEENLPGQLLRGFEELDPAFHTWLIVKRQSLIDTLTHSLEATMEDTAAPRAMRDRAAEALIHLDPTHEKACRSMIETLTRKGNVAAALRVYNQLWELLGEDYDMEPAEETQQLIARVKAGEELELPADAPEPLSVGETSGNLARASHLPVIGLARFIQRPVIPDGDYVVEGFRRDLIASLVRFREWIILDRDDIWPASESARNRGSPHDDPINYLVEGTCFGEGDHRHLIITLKDALTGRYVWSERYQLTLSNWFAAQQEIIRRISVALNVHISAERLAKRVAETDMPRGAFDLWLKGQALIGHWRPDTGAQAENIFSTIIRETPNFAPAYSSLASIYNAKHIVYPGTFRNAGLEIQAQRYAQTAVEIDPLDTRAQLALAWSNAMRGRYDAAQLHYGLSYDLNSGNPTTLISCAQGQAFCGQPHQARWLSDLAVRINPTLAPVHWAYLVGIRFICEDYEGSAEAAEYAQDSIANIPAWKAAALAHLGRREDARDSAERFLAVVRANWVGERDSTDEAIVEWYLQSFPIRDASVSTKLREGLRLSGLPALV